MIRLNHRVTLLRPVETQDATGAPVGGFTPLPEVWADVRFVSGQEVIKSGAPVSSVKASVCIRARSDITTSMRLVFKGETYDIKAAPPSTDRKYMTLVCESLGVT